MVVSGSDVSPFIPVLIGFIIAMTCTPAGVSGAFLLLPFQFTVLGFTGPGVTPTNLLYNVFSTPGGILQYRGQGDLDRRLVSAILMGAVPGIVLGSLLRITVFPDPGDFKRFVGLVLFGLGVNLFVRVRTRRKRLARVEGSPQRLWISGLGLAAGMIGGIYGISGGSIIAPVLVSMFGLPVRRVAPAALVATLLTSAAGVASFHVLDLLAAEADPARGPDWLLALLFGIGGVAGSNVGARLNKRLPEVGLRILLGAIAIILGISYVFAVF